MGIEGFESLVNQGAESGALDPWSLDLQIFAPNPSEALQICEMVQAMM